MRYTHLIQGRKGESKIWVTVGAVALLLLVGREAPAAPSWGGQPAWAADDGSSSPPSRRSSRDSHLVAPFSPGSHNLSLDVGQVFLMGDLATNYADSIGSQLHYTYGVSDMFGFDSSVGYSSHSDGKFSMTTALTGLRMNLSWYDKVVPYLVFGLGFYRPSIELNMAGGNITSVSPIVFGVHLGPGVHLELTKQLFFGAALTFHDMFGTTQKLPDNSRLDIGGTYTSFFLNAGVSF